MTEVGEIRRVMPLVKYLWTLLSMGTALSRSKELTRRHIHRCKHGKPSSRRQLSVEISSPPEHTYVHLDLVLVYVTG